MWFPKPYLPKSQFGWKIENRQRFARWYWNPMWKMRWFCAKWLTPKGVRDAWGMLSLRVWLWRTEVLSRMKKRRACET